MTIPRRHIAQLTLVVRDYDEAIAFYTRTLGFTLLEDTRLENGKRWVVVSPDPTVPGASLLLARGVNPEQLSRVGNQTGGRVFLFLATTDFAADYALLTSRGVKFVRPPRDEPYGTVAVFEDLCGNLWDLIEYNTPPHPVPDCAQ